MSSPTVPIRGFIYCLNCFYNLHGLIEHRCPECGRRFDPDDETSFSGSPNPQHLPKLVQRVALAINETVEKLTAPDSATLPQSLLRQRVISLERANDRLRLQIEALFDLLENNGVLTALDIAALRAVAPATDAEALEQVVDEDSATTESSPDLDALSEALQQTQHSPGR